MTNEQLIEENKALRQDNADLKNDLKEITRNLFKVVGVIGLTPDDLQDQKKTKKKALKSISGLAMDAIADPSGIEQKFSFLASFKPLFEKHKYLVKEIEEEENGK